MRRAIDKALTPAVVVVAIAALGVGLSEKQANDAARDRRAQVGACERGKQDRMAQARVYVAMATYYQGVTTADSVQRDVKNIAGDVLDELAHAADGMKSRILLCDPFVRAGQQIPDQDLLQQLPPTPAAP